VGQLVFREVALHARGHADDERPRRHLHALGHESAGADERALATIAPSNTREPMPINAPRWTVQPCTIAPWPMVTSSPMIVAQS